MFKATSHTEIQRVQQRANKSEYLVRAGHVLEQPFLLSLSISSGTATVTSLCSAAMTSSQHLKYSLQKIISDII